jgi:release factor glutamine methyltransferase
MQIAQILSKAQKSQLRTELEVFLAHLLDCSRLDLIARSDEEVPVEHLAALQMGWMRILKGYPVAYLTHEKEFYGLNFYVDERVLIPRGETEFIVEFVLEQKLSSVLELGTGSGAIAVALAKTQPNLRVCAMDVSVKSLEVAALNIARHEVDVELRESDLLAQAPDEDFDVLVANLPYIGTESHNFITDSVADNEPHLALFGGPDGLGLYRRLFDEIKEAGRNFKFIVCEIAFSQGPDAREMCKKYMPNYAFELKQDLQGLDRHFILRYNALI